MDPASDQLTSIQLAADASLTDAAQMLGNALSEDDSVVQQYWVNLDPESQDDVIPRLPHGDPIFEINLVLLSARPGGKRWAASLVIHLTYTIYPTPLVRYTVWFSYVPMTFLYHIPCTTHHIPRTITYIPHTMYHIPYTIYHIRC